MEMHTRSINVSEYIWDSFFEKVLETKRYKDMGHG